MNFNDVLNFEIVVGDLAEDEKPQTVEELEHLSSQLHESVENAIEAYASDNGIEGYEPWF